jgi:hypothetical protein
VLAPVGLIVLVTTVPAIESDEQVEPLHADKPIIAPMGFVSERDSRWTVRDLLLRSLDRFPAATRSTRVLSSDSRPSIETETCRTDLPTTRPATPLAILWLEVGVRSGWALSVGAGTIDGLSAPRSR